MKRSEIYRQLVVTTVLLIGALALFELTNLDRTVQDLFYRNNQWLVDAKNPYLRFFFYDGAKALLILLGVITASGYVASFWRPALARRRKQLLLLFLALSLVPLIIAGLKDYTNVYFPSQLEIYGGDKPYVKVFESYPKDYHQKERGRGFPAGHASGGFALMVLYFIFTKKQHKRLGLLTGIIAGWAMGLYQMLKGAHFLSHTVVTALGAWIIILLLYRWIGCDSDENAVQSV